ncbi:hypothetical protein SCHPADRAFT_1000659 [Schizopora paradoxa]|uniref:MYND-type domain-containing protein n=1 Tax=Schizopora paradoxa TaxID=27342 RepID=A0A0H2RAI8_9AGAM|nr:hypothetical protein SCHPADRAFT_1000659 [Schizopora paradoxa]
MQMLRERRNGTGGKGGSQMVQMCFGSRRNVSIPEKRVESLIDAARTDFEHLVLVNDNTPTLPLRFQAQIFDVFRQHLQTPVDEHLCEKDDPYEWIMFSLKGMIMLGTAFFERNAVNMQCFINCWPDIFKWLQALFVVREACDREGPYEKGRYTQLIGEAYNICLHIFPKALEEEEVIGLAIRVCIGDRFSNDEDHFILQPFLACMVQYEDITDVVSRSAEKMLEACDLTAEDLVDKIVARLKRTSTQTTPMDLQKLMQLANTLGNILYLHPSLTEACQRSSVGSCLVAILKVLMDKRNYSAHYKEAALSVLATICGCSSFRAPKFAHGIVEEGILILLPRAASLGSDPTCKTMAIGILDQLLSCLTYSADVVDICRDELRKIYSSNSQFVSMLDSSPKDFQVTWGSFIALLLENAVLRCLFKKSYAPENGTCANRDCRRLMARAKFMKCAGCAFTLYCSPLCQKAGWGSHRMRCKNLDGEHLNILRFRNQRLPRRMTTLHIQRYWTTIVRLSQEKGILLKHLAVRVSYDKFPFSMQVFDWRGALNEATKIPHLALAAETLHHSGGSQRNLILVLVHMQETDYPCIVFVEDKWTRGFRIPQATKDLERTTFVDDHGKPLVCEEVDALRVGVCLAKKYAVDMGKTVWDNAVLHRATEKVLEEFEQELLVDSNSVE